MRACLLVCALAAAQPARADEVSAADKLRTVFSNQFTWTVDGLPIVTVRVAEGRSQVVVRGSGVRLLPDGEGGAAVQSGERWTVRVVKGVAAKTRWHVVVGRHRPGDPSLAADLAAWKERGQTPRTFEIGALFAVRGEVIDAREILVAVAPSADEARARAAQVELSAKHHVPATLHAELVERPAGTVEATDERGAVVRNDAIVWFSPGPSGLLELEEVDKEGGGRETRRYFGKLYVAVDARGTLAVVNAVPEDKLLAGLVPAEMMPTAPAEALKAQAIAARNELLAKIGTRHLTDPYRLCATQHCQVYAGAGHEDARATAAVEATRGEVLEREGGGLVDSVYSASCGGHTEDNERAWGGVADASLRGRPDRATGERDGFEVVDGANVEAFLGAGKSAWCTRASGSASSYRWTRTIDLARAGERSALGALTEVTVLERGVSGRAVRLKLRGERGEKEVRGELEIRRALGGLKSALFVLDAERDPSGRLTKLTARGGGHGHGIGMCQMGAVGMAEAGKSYREILEHYYRAAHLRRLY